MPPKRSTRSRSRAAAAGPVAIGSASVPQATPQEPQVTLPYPHGWWRVWGCALALFVPPMGMGLALLYWPGPDGRSRRFSRWCLVLACLGVCLAWFCGVFWAGLRNGDGSVQAW